MLDHLSAKLAKLSVSLEQAKVLEGLILTAEGAENFAVITKDDVAHFVVMSPDQARVVNGHSIALTTLPKIREVIKDIVVKDLKAALARAKEDLAVLEDAKGNATTSGVTGGLPKLP